jgi:hypothetical protein
MTLPKRMWAVICAEYAERPDCGIDLFPTRRIARYYAMKQDKIVQVEIRPVRTGKTPAKVYDLRTTKR